MDIEITAEERLQAMTADDARDWIVVGHLLLELEAQSRAAPSGRSWQDIVGDRLAELGAPISPGHLAKIRRAYGFLRDHAGEALTPDRSDPPRISAVEVAERLYRLDPEAGAKALVDALAPIPVSYVELKRRYDAAREARPEMRSSRQIGWEARRKSVQTPGTRDQGSAPDTTKPPRTAPTRPGDPAEPGPPAALRKKQNVLMSQVWNDGWKAAASKYAAEAETLRETISAQAEEIRGILEENGVLARKVRDLRGYPEDFEDWGQ